MNVSKKYEYQKLKIHTVLRNKKYLQIILNLFLCGHVRIIPK